MNNQPKVLAEHDVEIAARHGVPMDDTPYYHEETGIAKVDSQRWQAAQSVEHYTWFELCPDFSDDRSLEHSIAFDRYNAVPSHLGDVLEIGCGPFTQSRTILTGRTFKSLTLLDPLLTTYLGHPHCTYKTGTLYGAPASLLALPAEELPPEMKLDTIICINVLEHVRDAELVISKTIAALRDGGVLILGEKCHDDYHPSSEFNLAHPLMLKRAFFQKNTTRLERLFLNDSDDNFYLVGKKNLS